MMARLAWARGDWASAIAWTDSMLRSPQPAFRSFGLSGARSLAMVQGRLTDAARNSQAQEEIDEARGSSRYRAVVVMAKARTTLGSSPDAGVKYLDSVMARHPLDALPPANRPYAQLAIEYARGGAVTRAEALMRDYAREMPEVVRNSPDRFTAEGMIAQARGEHARAIELLRTSRVREGCITCRLSEIGQSFEALGQPDSALVAYEHLATAAEPYPFYNDYSLPGAYRRLGELYEAKGDTKKALEYYGKFVDLWKDADASLQPRVAEVRKRIAVLSARER
jgi:tetratricopeptide (TPR) repeat protein